MGTRAYLACTLFDELVEGHCYIVPIQHHLSTLEADDDVWDEIRVCPALSVLISKALTLYPVTELHEMSYANVRRRG